MESSCELANKLGLAAKLFAILAPTLYEIAENRRFPGDQKPDKISSIPD